MPIDTINEGYSYLMQGMIGFVIGGVIALAIISIKNYKYLGEEK